ncbi:unnamed protein product [Didymodactylos carnosus]|uniref:Uncharacterized protein n=1 Tax=Didymodactylos carnosus TaxID=1234261 RepID=A0A815JL22_9BILA|nr:unnamed protein product [Didymodactylos carnosus]CAF1447129.1 unnamed protein product [Didymodactylos carnosus]CAF4242494.1 unnamed protein product [Didymodactylos carnosus]CAF4275487.1 unnamed protein product [Didymodactylos carnosus]
MAESVDRVKRKLEILSLLPNEITLSLDFVSKNRFKTFQDPLVCITYLTEVPDKEIFIIIPNIFAENVVPIIHNLTQIKLICIYKTNILTDNKKDKELTEKYVKISGIFNDKQQLINTLLASLKILSAYELSYTALESLSNTASPLHCDNEEWCTTLFSSLRIDDSKNLSLKTLNKEQSRFIWFQFLVDSLRRAPSQTTDNEINNYRKMTEICRLQFKDNNQELKAIDEFEKTYTSHPPIWWYTHKMHFLRFSLNRALCSHDIGTIFQFRYFIVDLYNQLLELSSSTSVSLTTSQTVYQVQTMSYNELARLKLNTNALISMNTFISTFTSYKVALSHISEDVKFNKETILFEIEIGAILSHREPFAYIQDVSYLKQEDEMLFLMGTVFRLESIEQLVNKIWRIRLKLTENELNESQLLLVHYKREFGERVTITTLGMFWTEAGRYTRALDYYKILLNEYSSSDSVKIALYNNMVLIYEQQDKFTVAEDYYEKALKLIADRSLPSSPDPDKQPEKSDIILIQPKRKKSSSSVTYYNFGCVMFKQGNYEEAFKNFQKAFDELAKCPNTKCDTMEKADIYNNIGCIHYRRLKYDEALENFRQAYKIALKISSPLTTEYLNNILATCRIRDE